MLRIDATGRVHDQRPRPITAAFQTALHRLDQMNVFLDGRFAVLHGELGRELHGPDGNMPAVYDALWAAGEAHGIANYDSFAMNAMRMEKGFKGAGDLEAALADEKITIIADVVGGAIWPALINVLTRGGRYTCSGAIAGPMVNFDLRTFYLHDLTFTGSTVIDQEVMPRLIGYIEAGKVKPVLAATYALTGLHDAQRAFIAKAHTGNIVVCP